MDDERDRWPALPWSAWESTAGTLHMVLQIVGKTRLALTPLRNHWWNVPLYLTARGVSTSVMPLSDGSDLDVELDFIRHHVVFRKSSGRIEELPLVPQTVAAFYAAYRRVLGRLGIEVRLNPLPCEVTGAIRFDEDTLHRDYDADAVHRFWRALSRARALFEEFSGGFYGKISPVHLFWGSLDLAVTRFNGRRAPERPGADAIQREADSHECISAGFWPGNGGYGKAAFYAYAAPAPPGLAQTTLAGAGRFDGTLGEFVLDYDEVRAAKDPDAAVRGFLQETYAAAADLAGWDRASLDRT
jgi:hypothetical protein